MHVVDSCRIGRLRSDIRPLIAVFVLELVEDDVTSVGDSVRKNSFRHLLHIRLPCSSIPRVIVAKGAIIARGQPAWESATVRFGVDIRTGTEDNV